MMKVSCGIPNTVPLAASTPITRYGSPRTLISEPTALPRGKQFRRHVGADVSDTCSALVLGIGDEPSFRDVAIFDVDAVGGGAGNKNVFQHFVPALHFDGVPRARAPILPTSVGASFQILVVVHRQVFIASLGRGDRVGVFEVFERIEALDRKRLRADAGDFLVDVTIESIDKRNDDDKRRDADNHAEQSRAERSLCAQIADTASLRVSINFTALLRDERGYGCIMQ